MKLKKILQNSIMETFFYVIIAVVGLLKVKYIIAGLGSEMNGYFQFINSIVSYVSLAEAGIASAVLFKMYKPVAKNEHEKISSLFNGSKKIFKGIAWIFLSLSLVLMPLIYFYTKEINLFLEIYFCFIMLIIALALPYMTGTRSYTALLTADQKRFIYGLIYNISRLLTDVGIIFLVLTTKQIISIVIINLVFKIVECIAITSYCKKKYSWLDYNLKADMSAKKMSGDMVFHQIGYVLFNNVDTFILMSFLGPFSVSVYASYNYIVTFIRELIEKNNNMINNIFGYSFAAEDKDNYKYFNCYSSMFCAIGLLISLCFLLGARSFINLWIQNSEYLLDFGTISAFSLIILCNIVCLINNTIINSNGLYKESKFFPLIELAINIILSIILLNFIGLKGILFATAIASFIGLYIRTRLISNKVFDEISHFMLIKRTLYTLLLFIIMLGCIYILKIESIIYTFSSNILCWVILMAGSFIVLAIIILTLFCFFDSAMKDNYLVIKDKLKGLKHE